MTTGSRMNVPFDPDLLKRVDTLDQDIAIIGEALSLFVHFWLKMSSLLPESAKQSARIKGNERFEGFM